MDEAKRGQKGGDDDNSSGREGLHETARVPEMTQRNELFEVDRINCRNEDGSILLPESFVPSTYDCIVGWARQNHRYVPKATMYIHEHSGPLVIPYTEP